MLKLYEVVGNVAAVAGVLVCAGSGLARITGNYYILGFEAMTLFSAGIALMLLACLAKLQLLGAK